jgi:Tol biopolymer transport system component
MHSGARPTGTIAFARGSNSGSEIWRVAADGGAIRRLTRNAKGGDEHPAWSPDGSKLAFARSLDGSRSIRIYVMRANGRGIRAVSPKGGTFAGAPAWSPDGRWIAFSGGGGTFGNCRGDLFVVHPDGSGLRRILRGRPIVGEPAWSADGKQLAIARVENNDRSTIFIATANGKHQRRLTSGGHPVWSPDGKHIAFTRGSSNANHVYTIGSDGRGLRRLTRATASELEPTWSPDGDWIAYWSVRADRQDIYATTVGSGTTVRLTHPPANAGDREPAWQPETGDSY